MIDRIENDMKIAGVSKKEMRVYGGVRQGWPILYIVVSKGRTAKRKKKNTICLIDCTHNLKAFKECLTYGGEWWYKFLMRIDFFFCK